ncbi:MAG: hypothetical protein ABMA64_38155 [Myxococcota bacterium]
MVAAASLSVGCSVHRVGLIAPADPEIERGGVELIATDGSREPLVLVGSATGLRQLDQHLVELDGRKGFGKIQVTAWRALEGPHGLAVYVGPVQRLGVQIGIADPSTGQLLVVDERAARELSPWLGDPVAVEGWIDGPLHLQVVGWVVLDPPRDEAPAPE